MALEIDQSKGVLFPNDYKTEGDNQPDFRGEIELPPGYGYTGPKENIPEGISPTRLRIVVWDNTSKAGKPYRSIEVNTPKPPKQSHPSSEDSTYKPTSTTTSKTELPF